MRPDAQKGSPPAVFSTLEVGYDGPHGQRTASVSLLHRVTKHARGDNAPEQKTRLRGARELTKVPSRGHHFEAILEAWRAGFWGETGPLMHVFSMYGTPI
jgi:hypothetical protein